MHGIELNKIAAAILIAGIIAMLVGNIADIIYQPNKKFKRGYEIEVPSDQLLTTSKEPTEPEQLDIALLMSKADAEAGQKDTKKCAICHTFTKNGVNRIGPNLWNVINAKKANIQNFVYSKAMASKEGVWDYESLFALLISPRKFVPGTKMAFAGYKNPQNAADIIAYLRTLSDNPAPLPKK